VRKGGSWHVQEFVDGTYQRRRPGRADDRNDADGDRILTFSDAVGLLLWRRHQDENRDRRAIRRDLAVDQALGDYL
jgi:hypothetical protein